MKLKKNYLMVFTDMGNMMQKQGIGANLWVGGNQQFGVGHVKPEIPICRYQMEMSSMQLDLDIWSSAKRSSLELHTRSL